MKIKAFFAATMFCVATSAFAGDAPSFKEGVDADAKAAVETAIEANKAASKAKGEWFWAKPVRKMWTGSKMTNGKILDQAIEMVNEGKNDEAKAVASFIEMAVTQSQEQAKLAPKAGPALYGM